MQTIIYAATKFGYSVQFIDNGEIIHEYTAGNHSFDSQTVINPNSPYAVKLPQLKRFARQTATEIARERGIPSNRVEYDPDLKASLMVNS